MPIHLKCKSSDLAEFCLLPGDPGRTEIVAKKYLAKPKLINSHRSLVAYTGKYKDIPVSVVTTGMGCPSAAIVVEELAKLKPGATLIRIGTCGGVPKSVRPGDLVIPNGAVPLVGILKSYGVENRPPVPAPNVFDVLVKQAYLARTPYHAGMICTSDAFYQEKTEAKVWEKKGVLACEMECAGIFALARLRGLKAGAVLTATGNILYGKQVMDTPAIRAAIKTMIQMSLDTIENLYNL